MHANSWWNNTSVGHKVRELPRKWKHRETLLNQPPNIGLQAAEKINLGINCCKQKTQTTTSLLWCFSLTLNSDFECWLNMLIKLSYYAKAATRTLVVKCWIIHPETTLENLNLALMHSLLGQALNQSTAFKHKLNFKQVSDPMSVH